MPGSLDRLWACVDHAAATRPTGSLPALFEGTGESSIYRYECCRSQRMAIAPQIGGR